MNQPTAPVAGFLLSLTAAILWGVLPIALKELLVGMDATTIVWYRFLVAGLALFAWLAHTRQLPRPATAATATNGFLLAAAIALCLNYLLFSYSLVFVNAETSEAVIQLTTLFLILGGVIIYREPFLGIQKFGTALIVIGLVLFFNERLTELAQLDNRQSIGVFMVILAAITWTVYALLQKKLQDSYSSGQILAVIYLFSVLVLAPFIRPGSLFALTGMQLGLLAFCCLNTLIAYGCFAEALKLWHASKVSATLALAPLFTIGGLKLIVWIQPDYPFSDRLSLLSLGGAALLVLGSVLAALVPAIRAGRPKGDWKR